MEQEAAPHAELPALVTERELEYIKLACRRPKPTEGEIAECMGISRKTVQKHADKVYKALGVNCYFDMYSKAVELGLVPCMCERRKQGSEPTHAPEGEEPAKV